MMRGLVESLEWAHVGAMLANSDDDDQVAFFRGFVSECRTWGTSYQIEKQLAGVNEKLTNAERSTLSTLGYEHEDR